MRHVAPDRALADHDGTERGGLVTDATSIESSAWLAEPRRMIQQIVLLLAVGMRPPAGTASPSTWASRSSRARCP